MGRGHALDNMTIWNLEVSVPQRIYLALLSLRLCTYSFSALNFLYLCTSPWLIIPSPHFTSLSLIVPSSWELSWPHRYGLSASLMYCQSRLDFSHHDLYIFSIHGLYSNCLLLVCFPDWTINSWRLKCISLLFMILPPCTK